jgi:hypothetical protein
MMTVIQQQGILSRPISTVNILGGKHRMIKFSSVCLALWSICMVNVEE